MALAYTYLKYKDVHTIENQEVVPLQYSISKVTCDTETVVSTGTILAGVTFTLNFKVDGIYRVTLTHSITSETETLPDIFYYFNLITSYISNIQSIFCGCTPCDECEDCNECEDYLKTLVQALAYTSLNEPDYQVYVEAINEESKCLLNDHVLCSLIEEKVRGNSSYKDVILYFLANYYGAFYFREKFLATNAEEATYVTTKYKYLTISKCMKKAGLNPSNIVCQVEANTEVCYWQLNNTEDRLEEVIPLINESFLSTLPRASFSDFEVGKIVSYTEVGRICFAISPTQVQDFVITDSLNNDITDAFDVDYNETLDLALFVSKAVYSYSSIYFKFKKTGITGCQQPPNNTEAEGTFNDTFNDTFN